MLIMIMTGHMHAFGQTEHGSKSQVWLISTGTPRLQGLPMACLSSRPRTALRLAPTTMIQVRDMCYELQRILFRRRRATPQLASVDLDDLQLLATRAHAPTQRPLPGCFLFT